MLSACGHWEVGNESSMKQNTPILAADWFRSTWGNDWGKDLRVHSFIWDLLQSGTFAAFTAFQLFAPPAAEQSGSYSSSSTVPTTPYLYLLLLRRWEHKLDGFVQICTWITHVVTYVISAETCIPFQAWKLFQSQTASKKTQPWWSPPGSTLWQCPEHCKCQPTRVATPGLGLLPFAHASCVPPCPHHLMSCFGINHLWSPQTKCRESHSQGKERFSNTWC